MRKKIWYTLVLCVCMLFAAQAQETMVYAPSIKSIDMGEYGNVSLGNEYISIDTAMLFAGDSIVVLQYANDSVYRLSYPITRIDRDGTKITYRSNPSKRTELAILTIYTDYFHYNVDNADGTHDCYLFTEQYGVLRRRSSYGIITNKFQL